MKVKIQQYNALRYIYVCYFIEKYKQISIRLIKLPIYYVLMWILEFKDYKAFLRAVIKSQPKKGFGQGRRLADYLNVAPIAISQVISGDRHFTADQAMSVAEFFGFDKKTTEFFVFSVSFERSDTLKLKTFYQEKLNAIREEANKISSVAKQNTQLSDQDKGIFYSNWFYSGVSLLISVPGFDTVEAISKYFNLPRARVSEIVNFLKATGLCREQNGKLVMGTTHTHIDAASPFIDSHRRNWRSKAVEKFPRAAPDDLFFSSPGSMSKKDAELFRKDILKFIDGYFERVAPSREETLRCLNIDWFEF